VERKFEMHYQDAVPTAEQKFVQQQVELDSVQEFAEQHVVVMMKKFLWPGYEVEPVENSFVLG
jgi:hypothetical protein